ncbi:MAG: hypothetical protein ACXABY_02050 [Candidatus Thorarchaeota archaeon]|jgi:hypothetical protein
MEKILEDIRKEREYQVEKWGNDFDDKNTANDWVTYITMYASAGARMDASPEEFRTAMVKVATLAVAALEAIDRNDGKTAPRHYDE